MALVPLTLDLQDVRDRDHWRWVLKDPHGAFLAGGEVALESTAPEYQGWLDLPGYLAHHADPDRRAADEARLLERFGRWLGAALFGTQGDKLLAHGPAVIRVRVPATPEAAGLPFRPFEAAWLRDRPLALHDLSLVFEAPGQPSRPAAAPISGVLRILAVFSLPPAGSPLNLRAERQMLKTLVKQLTSSGRAAITLRVLQYGTTRAILEAALEEGEGWDMVHFSGHGNAGELLLEAPDGRPDLIGADAVARLLQLARPRLKLVSLSACHSGAATVEETLRWLGLDFTPRRDAAATPTPAAAVPEAAGSVAQALVRSLDCGVMAMRFPVEDEFAIDLARRLYDKLLSKDQPLPRALQRALTETMRDQTRGHGALSAVTPALFGERAATLSLKPPVAPQGNFCAPIGFPPEARHFVGRVAALTRASAALAPDSGQTGVLFHGLAGGGKTACAVELANHFAEARRFKSFVWWKAPDEGADIAGALVSFAQALENRLDGFAMVHVVDRPEALQKFLPRLTGMLAEHALLLVLDNLESLLTPEGRWWDERWGLVLGSLLGHRGLTRTVLTSRIRPLGLPDSVPSEAIHALPLEEAVLLARQLPHLGRLIRGDQTSRMLVRRTLRLVQGHPKLIDLAEAQAASPSALRAQVEQAEAALIDGGQALEAFFRTGNSDRSPQTFLDDLRRWTTAVAALLPAASRTLFHLLCTLEESDRDDWVVTAVWPEVFGEAPPDLEATLGPVIAAGLVAVEPAGDRQPARYRLHPGVADAGRSEAGAEWRERVDEVLAGFWGAVFRHGLATEGQGGGAWVRRAGLAAAPYLLRRKDWETASALLERVVHWDKHPATLAAVLPLFDRIITATVGTPGYLSDRGIRARLLQLVGRPHEAEREMQGIIAEAEACENWRIASATIGNLITLWRDTGRAEPALALIERKKDFTRRSGFGPWTQMSDEGRRLQLLTGLGRHQEVFDAVQTLRPELRALPEKRGQQEVVNPWNVREVMLNTGHAAALALEDWQAALALNAEIGQFQAARGAPALERTRARFNDYGPLLGLGRLAEARTLLEHCRAAFEAADDYPLLGPCLTALADLEHQLGHPAAARRFEERALRPGYRVADPASCAISHFNLATYLMHGAGTPAEALAHRFAAVILATLTSSGQLQRWLPALRQDLARLGPEAPSLVPASFAELVARVEAIEGVRFGEMAERLNAGRFDLDELVRRYSGAP